MLGGIAGQNAEDEVDCLAVEAEEEGEEGYGGKTEAHKGKVDGIVIENREGEGDSETEKDGKKDA